METRTLVPTLGRRGFMAPFVNLRHEMDKLFNDWLAAADLEPLRLFEGETAFLPRIDATEKEKTFELHVELPGVEKKDIEIELTKATLILRGEKKFMEEKKEEGYFRQERRFGAFYREIALPWEVDVTLTKVEAKFANGVLEVVVPKPKAVLQATKKVAIGE
jgi:HSP20 family protein